MSSFLCKSILFYRFSVRNSAQTMNPNAFCSLRWFSVTSIENSFTVSYLINSLGFSQQSALLVSKQVSFNTKEKPDKAIKLLRDFGFTQTQISKLVRAFPLVLRINTEKIILPKLEFLESKGISRPELAKSLTPYPGVLGYSLQHSIMPRYNFFRSLFQSEKVIASAFRKQPDILVNNSAKQNIAILQEHKVPNSNIASLLRRQPFCFLQNSDRFRELVKEVVAMRFDASKMNFVDAVFALRSMTKSNWDSKVDLFKKWGWSHQEFLEAFKREPNCMLVSERKISACMDFLTNRMGWVSQSAVKWPLVFTLSLEKRVIPRCLVYQLIQSKGLAKNKKAIGLSLLLSSTEENFLKRFVTPYENVAPELLKFYEEKAKLSNGSSTEND